MTLNSDMAIGPEKHGSISSEDCMEEDDKTMSNAHGQSQVDSGSPELTRRGGRPISPIKGPALMKKYTARSKISGMSPEGRGKKRKGSGIFKTMASTSQDRLRSGVSLGQGQVSSPPKTDLKKLNQEGNVFFGGAKEKKAPSPSVPMLKPEPKSAKKINLPYRPTRGAKKLTQSLRVYKIGSYGNLPDASPVGGSRRQVASKTSIPSEPGITGSKDNKRPLNKQNLNSHADGPFERTNQRSKTGFTNTLLMTMPMGSALKGCDSPSKKLFQPWSVPNKYGVSTGRKKPCFEKYGHPEMEILEVEDNYDIDIHQPDDSPSQDHSIQSDLVNEDQSGPEYGQQYLTPLIPSA
jgi:hypothetical protein